MMQGMHRRSFLTMAGSAALIASGAAAQTIDQAFAPPTGFVSELVQVMGTSVHYVRGGSGPAIVLLHGFPEDWTEFRAIMPILARQFTVVAIDLPGIGQSAPATGGYNAVNLAAHVHEVTQALSLEQAYVVGHDLGGIVTYACIRRYPASIRGAMILDVPLPGIDGWEEAVSNFWHIRFIEAPGYLAEQLVTGRQNVFFDHLLSIANFTLAQREYYARVYGAQQLHAAFEIYRGFSQNARDNTAQSSTISVPLVIATGARSFFDPLLPTFIAGLYKKGVRHARGVSIPEASHYVLADNAPMVVQLIERYAALS